MEFSTDPTLRSPPERPHGSRWGWILGSFCVAVVGVAVGWAAATVLTPAEDPAQMLTHTYVSVAEGEVGASIDLNTVAQWSPVPVGFNLAAGVVTSVDITAGREVTTGDVLYRVNQRPVVVSRGDVPAYRAISEGAVGVDVVQAQRMLMELGLYSGPADGAAAGKTIAAIRAWQKSQGLEPTGVIEAGDIIFISTVPTRVSLNEEVLARGRNVSGGEEAVRSLPASPSFTLPVTDAQAGLMPSGTRVEITSPDGEVWESVVAGQESDDQSGTVTLALDGLDGAVICGDGCGQITVAGQTLLPARVVTHETVAGLVVPAAALITDAEGRTTVIDDADERRRVRVLATARGMSVVEGIPSGTRVRVPASETTS